MEQATAVQAALSGLPFRFKVLEPVQMGPNGPSWRLSWGLPDEERTRVDCTVRCVLDDLWFDVKTQDEKEVADGDLIPVWDALRPYSKGLPIPHNAGRIIRHP